MGDLNPEWAAFDEQQRAMGAPDPNAATPPEIVNAPKTTTSGAQRLDPLHPATPMEPGMAAEYDKRQLETDEKYGSTPGQIDPGYDQTPIDRFNSLSPEWQEFERTLDRSAGTSEGLTADEDLAYRNPNLSGKPSNLNEAGKAIVANTAPPEGAFDANTPHRTAEPVTAFEALTRLREATYIPVVTPFMEKEVVPIVADAIAIGLDSSVGGVLAEVAGKGKEWDKASDQAGEFIAEAFVPTHGLDFALEFAPGLGDIRGGVVGLRSLRSARQAATLAKVTRLSVAEGFAASGATLGPRLVDATLSTPALRAANDEAVRLAIKGAAPELTMQQVDMLIVNERMAGIRIANEVERIKKLLPDEMVTVYHGTTAENAEQIAAGGLRQGSFVTTSKDLANYYGQNVLEKQLPKSALRPDDVVLFGTSIAKNYVLMVDETAALMKAADEGIENPVVVSYQVPRRQLTASGSGFMADLKGAITATSARITNPIQTVRDWMKDTGLASERGAFQMPGSLDTTNRHIQVAASDFPPGTPAINQTRFRGTVIDVKTDPRVPNTVYHVSTDKSAVMSQGRLKAGGKGGLGGDARDRIVSFTVDKEQAEQLNKDMKQAVTWARDLQNEPSGSQKLYDVFKAQADKEGFDLQLDHAPNWKVGDYLRWFYQMRQAGGGPKNPIFMTPTEDLAKIDPARIGVVSVNKKALVDTGALVTDFDLDKPYGLKEIRIYGDVDVGDVDPDAARLAFGGGANDVASASVARSLLNKAQEGVPVWWNGAKLTYSRDSYVLRETMKSPERRITEAEALDFAASVVNDPDYAPLKDADIYLKTEANRVRALPDGDLARKYQEARQSVSQWQDMLDEVSGGEQVTLNDTIAGPRQLGLEESAQYVRSQLYTSLRDMQMVGEELARRTNGEAGLPAKIQSAIRKFIGDGEEGRIYLWGVGPANKLPKDAGMFPAAYGVAPTPITLPPGIARALEAGVQRIPSRFDLVPGQKVGKVRSVLGAAVPGFKYPRIVLEANAAREAVESRVAEFIQPLHEASNALNEAWLIANAQGGGGWKLTASKRGAFVPKNVNTIPDYLEHWWEYTETPGLIKARQAWDEAMDGALVRLNDEFGLQIEPYYPTGPMGERGSYVGHLDSVDSLKRRKKEGLMGPSSNLRTTAKESIQKNRNIPTIREAMDLTADYEPELDINTIATRYGAMMTSAAAKHTYETLIGGKTITELMEEAHPQLLAMRKKQEGLVNSMRQSLRNTERQLRQAGISRDKILREIDYVRKRESLAALRVEKYGAEGMERVAKLNEHLDDLNVQVKAFDRIAKRLQKQMADANTRFSTTVEARQSLGKLQKDSIDRLQSEKDKLLEGKALNAAAGKSGLGTPPINVKPIENNLLSLRGRIKGLTAFDNRLGTAEAGAARRIEILQEKLDELETLGRGITDTELNQFAAKIKAAEEASIKDAMLGIGAQRELGVTTTRLNEKLERSIAAINKASVLANKRQALYAGRVDALRNLRETVATVKSGMTKYYSRDPVTGKYVSPDVARASKAISQTGGDNGWLRLMEESRAIQLSTGDFSPLVYGRAQLGALGYAGTAIQAPKIIMQALSQGDAIWKGVNQDYLAAFQAARGRSVANPMQEIRPRGDLLIEKIGKIKKVNDTMNRIVTFAEFIAWETSTRQAIRRNPHLTLVEAGAASMKAMDAIVPRIDFARLGISSSASRLLNVPFTSLSYMASTPQFTAAYSGSLAKLLNQSARHRGNPVAAFKALDAADQETLIHGTELLTSLSVLSGVTAGIWGDPKKSVDERILDGINPLGDRGWTVQGPGGHYIPLAAPLRAGIRTTGSLVKGAAVKAGIPGAESLPGFGDTWAPAKYGMNRLISIPSFISHMALNEDWRGQAITSGSFWEDPLIWAKQAILYGMESASIVTSPTIRALRTGEVGNAGDPASVVGVVTETIESHLGLNIYDPSQATLYEGFQKRVIDELIKDGTISPEVAQYFKDTDFNEMPSSFRKLVESELEKRYPDQTAWYLRGRRQSDSLFQKTADIADGYREDARPDFDNLLEQLLSGKDPSVVWKAYDQRKQQLQGALNALYDDEKFQSAVGELDLSDMRRIEDEWNGIAGAYYERLSGALEDKDYEEIAAKQLEFLEKLANADPTKAEVFAKHLELKEQLALEDAHPMEALRKEARAKLAEYYKIPEEDFETRERWLLINPDADLAKWITSATESPTLHSVTALEAALEAIPGRDIRLSGTNLLVNEANLHILKQYDKEITRMIDLPPRQNRADGTTFNPVTELRKQSPLYDALYFWLGYSKPEEGKTSVPVFHPTQVQQYIRLWGPRSDGANIRAY